MTYDEAVSIGRDLVTRETEVLWEVGDLLKMLVRDEQKINPSLSKRAIVARWSSDTDSPWAISYLVRVIHVATKWPKKYRVKETSFSVHSILTPSPNRFEIIKPGMTQRAASALVGSGELSTRVTHKSSVHDLIRSAGSWMNSALKRVEEHPSFSKEDVEQWTADVDYLDDIKESFMTQIGAYIS